MSGCAIARPGRPRVRARAGRMRRLALLLLAFCLAGCSMPAPGPGPGAGDSPPGPAGNIPVVVTLGDSVPAGTACDCTPFPDLYAHMLSPQARSVNLAQPGYTASDVQGQLRTASARAGLHAATVVLVMVGANDLAAAFDNARDAAGYQASAVNVQTTVAAIVTTVLQIHATPVTVLVLGYWNIVKDGVAGLAAYGADGLKSADRATQDCDQALRRAAEQSGARYVTTTPVFKGTDRQEDPTALLAADGDHPNAAGHQAIADALYAAQPSA
jgi:acyl-CoA thioesterase-1